MRPTEAPAVTVTAGADTYPAGDFRAAIKLLRSLPDDKNGLASITDKKGGVTHLCKEGHHVHSIPVRNSHP